MLIKRTCALCSIEFQAGSANARYCSDAHRNKAYRQRVKDRRTDLPAADSGGTDQRASDDPGLSVYAATLAELQAAEQERTGRGLALLALARRIDKIDTSGEESGQSLSSLVLRYDRQYEVTIGRTASADSVRDEVKEARDKRERERGTHSG